MANSSNYNKDYKALQWVDGDQGEYSTPLSAIALGKMDTQIDGLTAQVQHINTTAFNEKLNSLGQSDTSYGAFKYITKANTKEPIRDAFESVNNSIDDVENSIVVHSKNTENPHRVTKTQVGLGNVDNTADTDKPVSDPQKQYISEEINKVKLSPDKVGLDNVPNVTTNDQTPTYVDAQSLSELKSGEKLTTAFSKIAKAVKDFIAHIGNTNNPHSVTKTQIGLSNVDNTSDENKPISKAVQSALDKLGKSGQELSGNYDAHIANKNNPHGVTKAQIDLGNVDNTSDMDKPVSNEQKAEIAIAKASGDAASSAIEAHKKDKNNPHEVKLSHLGVTTTADKLNFTSDVTSNIQAQINTKANASDIAVTAMGSTSQATDSYFKISNFGEWGTGPWYNKNFSMIICSRSGETVWVTVSADDSNTTARAVRLMNTHTKIKKIYFVAEENALYVHAAGWCNNITAHILLNVLNDYVPSITVVNSLPANIISIPIVEFGITSTTTNVGSSDNQLQLKGSTTRPYYNGGQVMLLNDMPSTEEWTFTLENGETVTKAVYVKK